MVDSGLYPSFGSKVQKVSFVAENHRQKSLLFVVDL